MVIVCIGLIVVAARPQTVRRGRGAPSVAQVAVDIVIPNERERVHEGRGGPGRGIVALLAVLWEAQGHMVGPARVVIRMARVAVR